MQIPAQRLVLGIAVGLLGGPVPVQQIAGGQLEHHHRVPTLPQQLALALQRRQVALDLVDIDQHQHRPVDAVVGGAVWPDPQRIPAPRGVLDLHLARGHGVDHFPEHGLQLRNREREPDIGDRTAQVA